MDETMDDKTTPEVDTQQTNSSMREALASLPSLDFDAPTDTSLEPVADATTIITHEMTGVPAEEQQNDAQDDEAQAAQEATQEITQDDSGTADELGLTEALDADLPTQQAVQTDADLTAEAEALSSLAPSPQSYQEPVDPAQQQTVMATPSSQPITQGAYNYETAFSQEAQQDMSERRRKVVKRVLIGIGATVLVLAIVYVAVSLYFTSHFFPNTTVNGEDVSGMAVSDLSAYVSSIGDNYKAKVSGDNVTLDIAGKDIGFVYDGNAYSTQAAEQIDAWRWPFELNQSHEYVVDQAITYNQETLEKIVRDAVDAANKGATQPTNATMTYDEAAGKFVVVPDALGTAINPDAVVPVVSQGVSTLQPEIKLGDDELVQPAITKDNEKLTGNIDTVNGMLDKNISLVIAGKDATSIGKDLMKGWFTLDGESNIQVNTDAVREWAKGPLSEQFDTAGTTRKYTRPDGKEITVEGGSADYNYGWSLDSDLLADSITNNLRTNNTDPIVVPMLREAATWNPGGQDWPARYIDVDLSEQYVRMYDESSNIIWETECVSGNPIYGGGTDTGVYFVYNKKSPETLKGLDYNGDGQPDYESYVTYWMPFDGGEGLHDASWRYSFGGNIYSYDGSHGCVNLPYSAAEQLYGIVEVGDPVVVHW